MSEQSSRTRGLIPFVKGQSGNPAGRAKGVNLVGLLREYLDDPAVEGSPTTRKYQFVARCVDLAMAGHPFFARLIWEYLEGKPTQSLTISGEITHVQLEAARQLLRVSGGTGDDG